MKFDKSSTTKVRHHIEFCETLFENSVTTIEFGSNLHSFFFNWKSFIFR